MMLTDIQKDSIKELINIAFGRAANSLSELTGFRVLINVPKVDIYNIRELASVLDGLIKDEICTVHQIFTGQVSGDALLMLDYKGATALTGLLIEEEVERIDVSSKEVLIEVGNILLNACLGTFGNMLHVHITFSVPRLNLFQLNDMLETLTIGKDELRHALVVTTSFRLKGSEIGGYLIFVLGVSSLDRFIECIDRLGK